MQMYGQPGGYGYMPPLSPFPGPVGAMRGPRYEIIHVNGKNGVDALQMAPNSNVLVMDDTAPIVWLCQTDGAGYKTATAFDIALHQDTPPVDLTGLEARIARIEEVLHGQSDAGSVKPRRKPDAGTAGSAE